MDDLNIIIDQAAVKLRGKEALARYLGLTNKTLSGVLAGEQELSHVAQEKLEKLMGLNAGTLRTTKSAT